MEKIYFKEDEAFSLFVTRPQIPLLLTDRVNYAPTLGVKVPKSLYISSPRGRPNKETGIYPHETLPLNRPLERVNQATKLAEL